MKASNKPNTVKTRINGPCARTLDLPLLVRSVFFYFFFCVGGRVFWCVFPPFSRGGNFGLHSTWSVYSSFYGTGAILITGSCVIAAIDWCCVLGA